MVQKNSHNGLPRSKDTVVEFDLETENESVDVKAMLGLKKQSGKIPDPNASIKYKGVDKRGSGVTPYRARLTYDAKQYTIGRYATGKEAAIAYDKAAIKLWGDNAYTNQMAFPEDFKSMQ